MKRKSTSPTRAEKRRRPGASKPTIGIGEDAIRGRGDGGRMPALGCGELGEPLLDQVVDGRQRNITMEGDTGNIFGESDDTGPDDAGGI